jgi:hypothetical protein
MLIHIDGFDSYAVAGDLTQEYTSYNCAFGTTSGRYGQGALNFNNYNNYLTWTYSGLTMSEIWTGMAVNITSAYGNGVITEFVSINGIEAQILYNTTTNYWFIDTGQGQSTITSVYYPVSLNQWHWLDIHYIMNANVLTGTVEVWVDGIQAVNCNGDTAYNGGNTFVSVHLGSIGNNAAYNLYYDDWYILNTSGSYNTTRLGDSRVQTLIPTSDAGPNDGTPSTFGAQNYTMVDEPQWNTSNLVTLQSGLGNAEVYGMSPLIGNITQVHAVRVLAVMDKQNSGNIFINAAAISNSVKIYSNDMPLTSSITHVYGIFEFDPNVSAAWSNVAINSSDFGISVD